MADGWSIGRHTFTSRLLVGTGKYPDFPTMQRALTASGAELVTVAVRRLDLTKKGAESLLEWIPKGMGLLPNTAACFTADEAIRTARLGRELLRLVPVLGDDRLVDLHRHPRRLHAEVDEEAGDGGAVGDVAELAVEPHLHDEG